MTDNELGQESGIKQDAQISGALPGSSNFVTLSEENPLIMSERVQLEVRVRMRAKEGQMTSALWSAATCRRFPFDGGSIAATSRRTPKELVQLDLTKAEPEATRTFNCTPKGEIVFRISTVASACLGTRGGSPPGFFRPPSPR